MRSVIALVLGLLSTLSLADEIKLNHTRPSRILGMLVNQLPNTYVQSGQGDGTNLIPHGLIVQADDVRGVLIVRGAPEDIEEFRSYVGLFDVKLRETKFVANIEAPLEKYRTRTESTIRNNATWGFEDSVSAIQCSIFYRLNDDNSFTVNLSLGPQHRRKSVVVRITPKQVIEVFYDEILDMETKLENIEVIATPRGFRIGRPSNTSAKATIFGIPIEESTDKRKPVQESS